MTGDTPLIEVRNAVKRFRRGSETVTALDRAALSLVGGELVALVGPSGSGKTTLLNVLAGWDELDAGAVLWDGAEVDLAALAWREMTVLPQRLGLLEELSVRENVELPLRLSGTRRGPVVHGLLRRMGLEGLADRSPAETSLGQQQRTALARALVPGPRLLLADEPAGHQDAVSAEVVFAALHDAAARGTCCLVATHNLDALRLCDRALRMLDGRIEEMPLPAGARAGR